jgi:8-oxo-dGTP pyrophosphatase MutT (NUDIX family)
LRSLLLAYRPHDAAEIGFLSRMFDLLAAPGDPLQRTHFEPGHFTASAFVLAPDGRLLLLIHHAKLDRWLQPGGHFERADADLLATARREATEETGLDRLSVVDGDTGLFDLDIHEIPARERGPAHLHFDLRFLLRAATWEPSRGRGVEEARWLSAGQAERLNLEPAMGRVLAKLRALGHASLE